MVGRLANRPPAAYGARPALPDVLSMLRLLRGLTNTWVARIFFLVLAGAFALWGVAG